jgi:hypothetical protein
MPSLILTLFLISPLRGPYLSRGEFGVDLVHALILAAGSFRQPPGTTNHTPPIIGELPKVCLSHRQRSQL